MESLDIAKKVLRHVWAEFIDHFDAASNAHYLYSKDLIDDPTMDVISNAKSKNDANQAFLLHLRSNTTIESLEKLCELLRGTVRDHARHDRLAALLEDELKQWKVPLSSPVAVQRGGRGEDGPSSSLSTTSELSNTVISDEDAASRLGIVAALDLSEGTSQPIVHTDAYLAKDPPHRKVETAFFRLQLRLANIFNKHIADLKLFLRLRQKNEEWPFKELEIEDIDSMNDIRTIFGKICIDWLNTKAFIRLIDVLTDEKSHDDAKQHLEVYHKQLGVFSKCVLLSHIPKHDARLKHFYSRMFPKLRVTYDINMEDFDVSKLLKQQKFLSRTFEIPEEAFHYLEAEPTNSTLVTWALAISIDKAFKLSQSGAHEFWSLKEHLIIKMKVEIDSESEDGHDQLHLKGKNLPYQIKEALQGNQELLACTEHVSRQFLALVDYSHLKRKGTNNEPRLQPALKSVLQPSGPSNAVAGSETQRKSRPGDETTIQEKRSLMPDNPLALVPYGIPEVTCFHNAQVLDSGAHKVVAFGITGHGKSSFLNFLLKAEEDVFLTSVGFMGAVKSVKKKTQVCSAMIGGEQWLLIDTPGFFDTDHLQERIDNPLEAQVEQQKQEFCRNIMRAYLEAGPEISAFLLVYNGSSRWPLEMSQQIKFLNSIQFPWSHCILVVTHADTVYKGVDDVRRYKEFFQAVGDPQPKVPEQLNKLARDTSSRVILVESLREDDSYHESVVTRMTDYIKKIEKDHGKCRNELFAIFGKKYRAECHKAYMSLLEENPDKLQKLVRDTKEDATGFVRAGQKVVQDHEELIRTMEAIAQLADNQPLISWQTFKGLGIVEKVVGGIAIVSGITAAIALPLRIGPSYPIVQRGFLLYAVGAAAALTYASLRNDSLTESEVQQAQSCLKQGQQSLQELYSHYQSLLTKIDEAGLNQHPSASDSLVAHLLAVHAHDAQERSSELLQAAQELSVFHTLRITAITTTGILTPEQAKNASANCALPIRFKIPAGTMDVAQAVGAMLQIVSISTNSTTTDSTLLRSSCIHTLVKEWSAIKTLCNIHDD